MDDIQSTLHKVINVVQHDIFFNDFVEIGFPPELFLAGRSKKHNYQKSAKDPRYGSIQKGLEWPLWNWWSLEYLRHQISIEHCPHDPSAAFAESAAKWGCEALPGFGDTADQIRLWIDKGDHRQPETYATALRTLMDLMRLPPIGSFSVLKQADRSGPRMEILN